MVFAGNPDRQGEAGAYELLMNPWARSAGLHSMTASMVGGVEAMRINPAGIGRIDGSQALIGHARYLNSTGISKNALGLSLKMGERGALGLSMMALDFGDIRVTTTNQPEGTGATFSPTFFHVGIGYSHMFENSISVGFLVRGINQSIADAASFGLAIDAGIQYVTGPRDNFKFGISLRNIGSPMQFSGEGLSFRAPNPTGDFDFDLRFNQRAASYELPSLLHVGVSYDFYFGFAERYRLTPVANFTANSFSRDDLGAGIEFSFAEIFMLRGGYKYEMGAGSALEDKGVYTGLAAGFSVMLGLGPDDSNTGIMLDYAYRDSNPFNGTHNITLGLNF
ncbi:MAG: type IX secretion system membrane protein PorP/SprF [Saprospirales bacterium]|nr:MAG: type IX secretion system membrane protein PorP/SprF [Saprospirales bacterium]